jgi:hypothetical protein
MTNAEAKALRTGDAVVWTGRVPRGPIPGVVMDRGAWHVAITWGDSVEQLASLDEGGDLRRIERAP